MIIRMNSVKKVNVSGRQIVTTVFLIQGHLRSDYKSSRSMIKPVIPLLLKMSALPMRLSLWPHFCEYF
jgi:hypothetical protein